MGLNFMIGDYHRVKFSGGPFLGRKISVGF